MRSIFITLSLLCSIVVFSQNKNFNEDLILFERTVAIHELTDEELGDNPYIDTLKLTTEEKTKRAFIKEIRKDLLEKVVDGYEELLEKFPKSPMVFRTLNNKGYAELELCQTDKAKETYLNVLNSKANDKEKDGIGSGIMGEPYANYKNRACKILANLELKNKNYTEALHYLDQTKKYPYNHFCGNEHAANDIYMANMYSTCYLALNNYEKAYDILLPNILNNGLANNSYLITTAFDALSKKYAKEDLKVQFENAFKNVSQEKKGKGKNEYTSFYITFVNRKIVLDIWNLNEFMSKEEQEKVISSVLAESRFYKLLSE